MTANKDFLPKGYTIPSTSKYMKFQDGTNVFRILDNPILGMEYWKTKEDGSGRLPVRKEMGVKISLSELEIDPKSGKLESPKHFWAMPVYNYQEKQIQILEITQLTLIKALTAYINNPKWGNPIEYDISITKSGSGIATEYQIDHDPKEAIDPEILKEFKETPINLNALFDGKDPFNTTAEEAPATLEEEIAKMDDSGKSLPF